MIVVLVTVLPPLRARAKAAPMLAEAVGMDVARPLAPAVDVVEAVVGGVPGDLYVPQGRGRPAVVFLPGATPAGRQDRRAVRAATALARSGRTVFVPELALYGQDLDEADIAAVRAAAHRLADDTGQPVVLVGISYGGALALLASAGLPVGGPVALVATFGAYFDLVGVVQAVTTGASLVGDRTIRWEGHPHARAILAEVMGSRAPADQQDLLRDALAGRADPDVLGPEVRALYDVIANRDAHRTATLTMQLDPRTRQLLHRFSPSEVADRITVPVVALHSTDDPAVPWAEALRLEAALPNARVQLVSLFRHIDIVAGGRGPVGWLRTLPDLYRTARFVGWALAAQEPWLPRRR